MICLLVYLGCLVNVFSWICTCSVLHCICERFVFIGFKLVVGAVLLVSTSQQVKWTSGARVIIFLFETLDRPIARSLDRSIARWLDRSIARSLDRSITRSLDRSVAMIIVHACTTIIVHACTMIIVHACTRIIVHVL